MIESIAIVGGTHGNETTGIQLVRNWQKHGIPAPFSHLNITCTLANTAAITENVRFLDEDLNRQFTPERLNAQNPARESVLAKQLNESLGPKGSGKFDLVIDIHNTTSAMGATLIILDTDDFNLNMARYVKHVMPEANVLVEDEKPVAEHPYLCTLGKYGVMIEVGAQPQGVMREDVYALALKMTVAILTYCEDVNQGTLPALPPCDAFRFVENIIFPKDSDGLRTAMIHAQLQDNDFVPLQPGAPMFRTFDGEDIVWSGEQETYPHFINEAAYHKLDVAFATANKFSL